MSDSRMDSTVTTTPRGKVLVVDDSPLALKSVRLLLEGAGYLVDTRDTAVGTAAAVRRGQPDVVLLDLNMPACTGEQVAAVLKRHSSVPVIFFSDVPAEELKQRTRTTEAIGALSKSVGNVEFLSEFQRLFNRALILGREG